MPGRRLGAEEAALWRRVTDGVRPLAPASRAPALPLDPPRSIPPPPRAARPVKSALPAAAPGKPPAVHAARTLDAGWDRRLARGAASPDRVIDLHGHSLAAAHARLDAALDDALRHGERVVLVVTGKPPRPGSEHPRAPDVRRGAIRAAIDDWLAASRHAAAIAAVRAAHPRHGGAGALYVVLRRAGVPRQPSAGSRAQ